MGYFDFFLLLWIEDKYRTERLMSGDCGPDVPPLGEPGTRPFSAFTPGFPQQDQGSDWLPACCAWSELGGLWRAATLSAVQTRFPPPRFLLQTPVCLSHSHFVFLHIGMKMTLGSYTVPNVDVFETFKLAHKNQKLK